MERGCSRAVATGSSRRKGGTSTTVARRQSASSSVVFIGAKSGLSAKICACSRANCSRSVTKRCCSRLRWQQRTITPPPAASLSPSPPSATLNAVHPIVGGDGSDDPSTPPPSSPKGSEAAARVIVSNSTEPGDRRMLPLGVGCPTSPPDALLASPSSLSAAGVPTLASKFGSVVERSPTRRGRGGRREAGERELRRCLSLPPRPERPRRPMVGEPKLPSELRRLRLGDGAPVITRAGPSSTSSSHSPRVWSCESVAPFGRRMRVISGSISAASRAASAVVAAANSFEPPLGPSATHRLASQSSSLSAGGANESSRSCCQGGSARRNRSTTRRRTPPLRPWRPQKRCCSRCSMARSFSMSVIARPPYCSENCSEAVLDMPSTLEHAAWRTARPRPRSAPVMSPSKYGRSGARTVTNVETPGSRSLSTSTCTRER